ncbi:hypothetical protein CG709_21015, partial [Lachnotalea glycerini]
MKIGVIDSGGKFLNTFFADKKISIICNKVNAVESNAIGLQLTHGEFVCATILKENPKAEIVLVPIIKNNRKCSVRDLIDAMQILMDQDVDLINLSLGNEYTFHHELEIICRKVWESGVLIVAAHSNVERKVTYPAVFPFVIGVSSDEKRENSKIVNYNEKNNEVIFSSNFFSIYHLGIPRMISGNSFGCAKITGLLSLRKNNYKIFLKRLTSSIFNSYYPYSKLKTEKCLFFTNRIENLQEQQFIREVTNSIECREIQKVIFPYFYKKTKQFEILFIDHDCYEDAL